jgi:hypothetical protein
MRQNIYIRQEDEHIWDSILDKPRFLHDALRSVDPTKYNKAVKERKAIEKVMKPYIDAVKAAQDNKEYAFCKHGSVKGFCKKGCK